MRSKDRVICVQTYLSSLFPDAHCELDYTDAFTLLCAVMLSAQTTDARVNLVTPFLFSSYPDAYSLSKANQKEIEKIIQSIGLFRNKASHLIEMSKKIVSDYDGVVPNHYEDLIQLPGVGRKTANVVLSEYFHIPRIAVDTHVERVSKRLGFAKKEDSVLEVEEKLMKLFPPCDYHKMHHQLLFFGRYHCLARNPKCENCELSKICKK